MKIYYYGNLWSKANVSIWTLKIVRDWSFVWSGRARIIALGQTGLLEEKFFLFYVRRIYRGTGKYIYSGLREQASYYMCRTVVEKQFLHINVYSVVYRDIEEWEELFDAVDIDKTITYLILVFDKILFVLTKKTKIIKWHK